VPVSKAARVAVAVWTVGSRFADATSQTGVRGKGIMVIAGDTPPDAERINQ
jgi:hypothetical protein